MSTTHDEQALAAAYVLGALTAAERQAFEAHVRTCAVCAEEVRSLQPVADGLAGSVPQHTPRPELRARVLTAVTGAAPALPRDAVGPAPRGRAISWLPLAAAILVAVGLGAYARQLQGRVSTLETRLSNASSRAAAAERDTIDARRVVSDAQMAYAILAAPDAVRVDLKGQGKASGSSARAMWSRTRGMVFSAANLPAPPAGKVYQVWVITANNPRSAGLLTTDASGRGAAVFQTPADIPTPEMVGVTLEDDGGAATPTLPILLVGTPAL
jgi:anti-sigma-K factor RskA